VPAAARAGSSIGPPRDARVVERDSDAECIAAIDAGAASAAVTATLLDDELASRGLRALSTDPVAVERRVVLVHGTGSGAAPLVSALNAAVADLGASGRLAEMSRSEFGGRDLTGGIR
jgi:ABC-type amino acid transport substrate-binding protein